MASEIEALIGKDACDKLREAGLAVVPVEPTEAIVLAALRRYDVNAEVDLSESAMADDYRAMIRAANLLREGEG